MRPIALAVLATLLACGPYPTPAACPPSVGSGPYDLAVVDEAGRPLPTFVHRGRTYVLGAPGRRYLLRVRNESAARVEVVASVDGRDVVDGGPAALEKRGYLVEPRGEVLIDGFRLNEAEVAAFRFSSVARSYAAQMGDARDVGVIGAAVFPERAPRPVPLPMPSRPDASAAPEREKMEAPAAAPQAGAQAPSAARSADAARPGLGTAFGERRDSAATRVPFERARATPDVLLTVRYDDRAGLAAAGVVIDRRCARADDAWLRETAEPFRASAGYATPPPGWRP